MGGSDINPITNFKFKVEFGGESVNFQEVDLPESEIEIIEYRDGSDVHSSVRKIPGLTKHTNLVLKRGMTKSLELYEWFKQTKQGPQFDLTKTVYDINDIENMLPHRYPFLMIDRIIDITLSSKDC